MARIHRHIDPGPPPPGAAAAVTAWNLMGGAVDWAALPYLAELLAVDDPVRWIAQLTAIRDFRARTG